MWTFLWTYVALLLGLNRLGRERLVPEDIPVDPILGLQPLGRIAATGLWMLLIWLVPVVLTGLPDVAGFIVGMVVLAAAPCHPLPLTGGASSSDGRGEVTRVVVSTRPLPAGV